MTRLAVRHSTVYRYARPVRFGEHRLMFRPRDSHDLRLVSTGLTISPRPGEVRWLHDVFSNSIAIAGFDTAAETLSFESAITVDHFGLDEPDFPLEPYARTYPFSYPSDEIPDLGRTIERHYPDPERQVDAWVKGILEAMGGPGGQVDTRALLVEINRTIGGQFDYRRRYAVGTQSPAETLALGGGSCRDLALFMMEAVRSLGLAARFVTGYLYDPDLDQGPADAAAQGELWAHGVRSGPGGAPGGGPHGQPAFGEGAGQDTGQGAGSGIRGAGDTHAWVQIYLPGAGWMEFDPTNGIVGGARLIRVGVARDPTQAIPLQGTYFGASDDFMEMSVSVEVTRLDDDALAAPARARRAG
jgi:transglutaminase-like putative cysteine protease